MFQKPVAKKIVVRDKKGKSIKQYQMPNNMNLIELAVWTKEAVFAQGEWARPCTVTIEDYKGNVQFKRQMRVNWKYLKRDIRDFIGYYNEDVDTDELNKWAHENGMWAA